MPLKYPPIKPQPSIHQPFTNNFSNETSKKHLSVPKSRSYSRSISADSHQLLVYIVPKVQYFISVFSSKYQKCRCGKIILRKNTIVVVIHY